MRITGVCLLVMVMAAVGCHKPGRSTICRHQRCWRILGRALTARAPACFATSRPCHRWRPRRKSTSWVRKGLTVQWDVTAPGRFDSEQLVAPARYNFPQGAMYRLKLANIPGRPGVEFFPTLEVGPAMPRTEAFLAHNAIPVEFTDEDFDQVMTRQLRDQSDLPARSRVPGNGPGRRRHPGQHAARSGPRPDRRGRPPRGDHGHRPLGQQGPASLRLPAAAGRRNHAHRISCANAAWRIPCMGGVPMGRRGRHARAMWPA